MLPSTGYFKTINCPFFESGFCERPYCHFRHVKRDHSATSSASKDFISNESTTTQQNAESAYPQNTTGLEVSFSSSTQVVSVPDVEMSYKQKKAPPSQVPKATYNPTPIAELNKMHAHSEKDDDDDDTDQKRKHIPVPYTPRKPNTLPVKRPLDTNGACKPFIFNPPPVKYTPGLTENVQVDTYTPKGSTESQHKYLPGAEAQMQEYTPNTNDAQSAAKHNYVPSDKSVNKKKVLEYKPMKVTTKPDGPTYKPTPKELVPCFSSDEDEPDIKKQKFDNDLNGMDDFASEFDMLGEILKEEIPQQDISEQSIDLQENDKKEVSVPDKIDESSKKSLKKHEHSKKSKSQSNRHNEKKTHERDKSEKKEKHSSSSSKTDRSEKKSKNSKDSSNKSHSTSSSKDKHKTDKYKSAEKKKSCSSKSSDKTSKHSENGSSRHSDKHSKHSRSHSSSKDKKKGDHHRSSKESKDSRERKKHKVKERASKNLFDDNNVHDDMLNNDDDDYTEMSDLDEEAIALECKKIFDEYVPTEKVLSNVEDTTTNNHNNQLVESDVDEYVPVKKRISHTVEKNVKVIPRAPLKPDYKISAAQAMACRLEKVREFHAARISVDTSNSNTHSVKPEPPKTSVTTPNVTSSKIRIAHVPYASTLLNAKRTIAPSTKAKPDEPSTSSTIAHTVPKGVQRVARIPNEKFIDRPGVLEPLASKIPANVRSTYLNMMIDECLKIYLLPTDAYARAQHEELATSKKCSTVQIYKNSAVLTVSRLRKELQECYGVKKYGTDCTALQNMPQGAISDNTGSWSIVNKTRKSSDTSQEFHGAKFYNNIKKWILTEEQLVENGFPRPHPSGEKGRAIIHGQNKLPPPKGLSRTCCRCKKDYTVDKKGFPIGNEECIYHPKNKYRVRGEVKYQCCSQDNSSDGCCIASCHVYEFVDYDNLKGYIRTMPPSGTMNDYGVYSLDCEMCYTTHGLDLTRITVINSACKVVYETLIKPLHPIIDYNTRYSGITEDQMVSVKTTLLEVQATLLTMFNSKTILVGHSLESDFKALKLIHDTVIDTSVLFPHKMGPPYKRALRNLSSEYLRKIIQNAVEGGHDSAEDATVCMELLVYKLKEDLKTR